EAPSELRRLVSLAWNARELSIVIGKHIDVRASIDRYRNEGAERLTRRLSSALRLFLQREERLIAGPTLLPKRTVRELVLRGGDYENVVAELAATEGKPETDIRRRAAKYFEEIAADYHGTYFALVAFVFNRIWPRIFGGFEQIGLERVVEHARRHPIVLVPCHRSHFDYLILSYLFHQQYLSPPHIAAGINLSFWPLGPLFRGAGAYFIRRSFAGDELYKVVFRNYLTFLIREGYTQEFFIEGGRSRTGKMLSPKLGMLSALVSAYLSGARRDLYFVPVSIHYGRVVEERAYERELQGAEKEKESLGGLLKARSLLRQYYGSVYVSFAEPISLRAVLGDQRERLQLAGTTAGAIADSVEQEKRELVSALALRILREVNNVTVAGATSVAATVLLGSEQGALRYDDFVARCTALGRDLEARQILLTASLRSALASGDFRNSCEFLGAAGLVSRIGGADDIVQVPPSKRLILDFYKNTALHFFLVPSLLVRAIGAGRSEDELEPEVRQWLDLFRLEFPAVPENLSEEIGATLLRLRQAGAVSANGQLQLRREHALVQALAPVLDNFREAYAVVERSLAELPAEGMRERQWRERVQQRYQAALLLGEARKPEGNSAATIDNALKINAARGLVVVSEVAGRGKRSRERVLQSPAPPP
ncbi:MAG TPA: 1-acyl-sn-glycerol-3-phosphate acyltransferase, partial [Terriglobales bacterium]|nr:1-acyl-sn-glycerol-3-phosphate acyltransferase [Terriglobales bacterium]